MEEAIQTYSKLTQRDLGNNMGLDLDHQGLMRNRLEEFRKEGTSALSGKRTRTQHSSNEGRDVK